MVSLSEMRVGVREGSKQRGFHPGLEGGGQGCMEVYREAESRPLTGREERKGSARSSYWPSSDLTEHRRCPRWPHAAATKP